ncbi:hypothetical protein SDC9_69011 [bioreactor metagenome]|uniref:Uncharacterized protein n=1 Tax=bioreactor metagenome TaxID=1076179 RepID=A0A644Y8W5_9ZZZZ
MTDLAYIGSGLGILAAVCAILFGYAAFARARKSDESGEGRAAGTMLTEIGYIKAGVDDIKRKQDKQDERYLETVSRLTAVEQSSKQAHKRIDRLEGLELHD